ncbi:NAD-dependent epimerase/dehydratase family protein [Sorangium sp. So ce1128]
MFHLATEKHQAEVERPREILRANVERAYQLLEAAVARNVKKVVFASSLYAYGRMHSPPFREDDLPASTTVYGLSKLAGAPGVRASLTLRRRGACSSGPRRPPSKPGWRAPSSGSPQRAINARKPNEGAADGLLVLDPVSRVLPGHAPRDRRGSRRGRHHHRQP